MRLLIHLRRRADNFFIFRRWPVSKQFVKFCIVGTSNSAVDIVCYWIFTRLFGWQYLVAAVGSFVAAVSWSFYFNRRWTFRHHHKGVTEQYVKFFVANVISMVLNLSLFSFLIEACLVYDLLAKIIASVAIAVFNFSLNKFWTFKKSAEQ